MIQVAENCTSTQSHQSKSLIHNMCMKYKIHIQIETHLSLTAVGGRTKLGLLTNALGLHFGYFLSCSGSPFPKLVSLIEVLNGKFSLLVYDKCCKRSLLFSSYLVLKI